MSTEHIMSDAEIKQTLLRMAKALLEICKENDLHIYASGGTLLGAVRHGGFIPWDDDIDFHMFRSDYIKLLQIMKGSKDRYKLGCYENDRDYVYPFAKFYDSDTLCIENNVDSRFKLGLYIDIFPVDGLGKDVEKAKEHLKRMTPYVKASILCRGKIKATRMSFAKKAAAGLLKVGCRLYGYRRLLRKVSGLAMEFPMEESEYCGEVVDNTNFKRICPKAWFDKTVLLKFEDMEIPCPIEYDKYLTSFYGDYMTPPPVEKQKSNHDMIVYSIGGEK